MGGALLANEAHVRIEGNLTSSSNGNSTITVYDGGIVEITGDVAYKGKGANAVFMDGGELSVKGRVTGADYSAVYVKEGTLRVVGNVVLKTRQSYAVVADKGEIEITGVIDAPYPYYIMDSEFGKITVKAP